MAKIALSPSLNSSLINSNEEKILEIGGSKDPSGTAFFNSLEVL